ncbi:hypothetical protein RRG08_044404 [Elysia crispata]|uniref:Uncharacterized protein n=1 Tax=Elysia crispata TaxID=231223 RepID=A0AAE0ZV92_9GAST|nr:hypothetical protein RRG08_044404 [Elysia crispata]
MLPAFNLFMGRISMISGNTYKECLKAGNEVLMGKSLGSRSSGDSPEATKERAGTLSSDSHICRGTGSSYHSLQLAAKRVNPIPIDWYCLTSPVTWRRHSIRNLAPKMGRVISPSSHTTLSFIFRVSTVINWSAQRCRIVGQLDAYGTCTGDRNVSRYVDTRASKTCGRQAT